MSQISNKGSVGETQKLSLDEHNPKQENNHDDLLHELPFEKLLLLDEKLRTVEWILQKLSKIKGSEPDQYVVSESEKRTLSPSLENTSNDPDLLRYEYALLQGEDVVLNRSNNDEKLSHLITPNSETNLKVKMSDKATDIVSGGFCWSSNVMKNTSPSTQSSLRKEAIEHFLSVELCHEAASGNFEEVQLLLEKNASVNSINYDGMTPLQLACAFGHMEVVKLLLSRHANVLQTDDSGNQAIDFARNSGYTEIVELCHKTIKETEKPLLISLTPKTQEHSPHVGGFSSSDTGGGRGGLVTDVNTDHPGDSIFMTPITFQSMISFPFFAAKMNSIVVVVVGLPGGGKTYVAGQIQRYFEWNGLCSKMFAAKDYESLPQSNPITISPVTESFQEPDDTTSVTPNQSNLSMLDELTRVKIASNPLNVSEEKAINSSTTDVLSDKFLDGEQPVDQKSVSHISSNNCCEMKRSNVLNNCFEKTVSMNSGKVSSANVHNKSMSENQQFKSIESKNDDASTIPRAHSNSLHQTKEESCSSTLLETSAVPRKSENICNLSSVDHLSAIHEKVSVDVANFFSTGGEVAVILGIQPTASQRLALLQSLVKTGSIQKENIIFVELCTKNTDTATEGSEMPSGENPYSIDAFNSNDSLLKDKECTYYPMNSNNDKGLSFIRIENMQRYCLNRIFGYIPSRLAYMLMNLRHSPTDLFLTRPGLSKDFEHYRLGENSTLTERGYAYSDVLFDYIAKQKDLSGCYVMASCRKRCGGTVRHFQSLSARQLRYSSAKSTGEDSLNVTDKNDHDVTTSVSSAELNSLFRCHVAYFPTLDEINYGDCSGQLLSDIEYTLPGMMENLLQNPYATAWPSGESIQQVFGCRLEQHIHEIQASPDPVLVVSHLNILQGLYSYFVTCEDQAINPEMAPLIAIPLETVIRIRYNGVHRYAELIDLSSRVSERLYAIQTESGGV